MIPEFHADGFLPEGVHVAEDTEAIFRFGSASPRRRRLALRVRRWIELARAVGARRLLIDGSFVTSIERPNDVDAVVLLPMNFQAQIARGDDAAFELEQMLLTRQPEEILGAESEVDWEWWVEFFGRTREADGRRKGLVEIRL